MDTLSSKVAMMEAERQQSEARVKDEVDASLGQKMGMINEVRPYLIGWCSEVDLICAAPW